MQSQAVIKKWDRKQLLQSSYKVWQKFITKCDRLLLQCTLGITECDKMLLQSVSGITKSESYYKVRHNIPRKL